MFIQDIDHPFLTKRFEDALVYATQLHARQTRKGTQIPYISHLLAVTALVLQDGGDEDQAIAALLHDAVEDQGGRDTLVDIRKRYGDSVANLVESCTDAYDLPKPPWQERKENYLAHLPEATPEARRISLADKLHNARSILRDLRREGPSVWTRFNGGREGTLWYYRSLVQIFQASGNDYMVSELDRVVNEIERLASLEENLE